jgi:hypothetical protein
VITEEVCAASPRISVIHLPIGGHGITALTGDRRSSDDHSTVSATGFSPTTMRRGEAACDVVMHYSGPTVPA